MMTAKSFGLRNVSARGHDKNEVFRASSMSRLERGMDPEEVMEREKHQPTSIHRSTRIFECNSRSEADDANCASEANAFLKR